MADSFKRYSGWLLLAHPHFLDQYSRWQAGAQKAIKSHPKTYHLDDKVKLFAHLEKRVFEDIPADPASPNWRLGNSLGAENKAWKRAKFGGQYRLFFRCDSKVKIIVYGWANDSQTLRSYDDPADAYRTFQKLLSAGEVPNRWEELLEHSHRVTG